MHFVMAFLLLVGLFAFVGVPTVTGAGVGGLYDFTSGRTPAQIAGLKPGDVFVSADGRPVTDVTKFRDYLEAHAGKTIVLVVRRAGHELTLRVTPVDGRGVTEKGASKPIDPASGPARGVIGIALDSVGPNVTSGPASFLRAGSMLGSLTKTTVIGVGQVFSLHGLRTIAHDLASSTGPQTPGQQASNADRPVSIVGVVQIASQAAQQDVAELLVFLAYVNIFFGLFNMFPMLPLDGGHVAIAIYERIRSRRGRRYFADAQKMLPFAYALLVFIAVFGLSALYLDIVNPVHVGG
jgi:membrane-associated protease RseP (regulator of RpoE activity)